MKDKKMLTETITDLVKDGYTITFTRDSFALDDNDDVYQLVVETTKGRIHNKHYYDLKIVDHLKHKDIFSPDLIRVSEMIEEEEAKHEQ